MEKQDMHCPSLAVCHKMKCDEPLPSKMCSVAHSLLVMGISQWSQNVWFDSLAVSHRMSAQWDCLVINNTVVLTYCCSLNKWQNITQVTYQLLIIAEIHLFKLPVHCHSQTVGHFMRWHVTGFLRRNTKNATHSLLVIIWGSLWEMGSVTHILSLIE